jgi:hypothetical protein
MVRVANWVCDCGSDMLFLDVATTPRRRMHCISPGCPNQFEVVLEPLFEAKPEPLHAASAMDAVAKALVFLALLLLAPQAFGWRASAQTKAAESTGTPMVYVYAPGFGIVQATLGTSITVTCTTTGVCAIAAVAPAVALPTSVGCEPYAVTAAQTIFPLKYTPVGPVLVHKNGLLLMNVGGLDYSISGATVTLSTAQAAGAGDGVCFQYSH